MFRKILKLFFSIAACAAVTTSAGAQSNPYPVRSITLVVPQPPGGATDLIGRLIAQHLSNNLGQTVIVQNKAGAGGNIGMSSVVNSSPDGYTLLLGSTDTIVTNSFLYKNLPFNPLSDFAPIALVADAPEFLVVSATLGTGTLKEFIEEARKKSGAFNFGSPGLGSIPYFAGHQLGQLIGTKMVPVPFRGTAPAMIALAAGDIQFTISTKSSAESVIGSGKGKFLAITSPQRMESLPDVPTAAEAGLPGYNFDDWFGVFAPRGTSPEIIARINASLQKMFDDPATVAKFGKLGFVPMRLTVQESLARIQQDAQSWKKIITDSGIQLE
jgi:tripartite-type tricarboxylate transporter receptor subunit TctC